MWANSALLCCVLVTGLTCRLKALPCPVHCTAGTAASTTTGTTRLHLKAALYIWSTAAHGHTATPLAPPSETSSQDKRWMSFSSSCTWALMCRRWPSSRAWTPASYWACSAVAAKRTHLHTVSPSYTQAGLAGLWPVSHAWYLQVTHPPSQPILPLVWPLVYFIPSLKHRGLDLSHSPFPHNWWQIQELHATTTRHNSLLLFF